MYLDTGMLHLNTFFFFIFFFHFFFMFSLMYISSPGDFLKPINADYTLRIIPDPKYLDVEPTSVL